MTSLASLALLKDIEEVAGLLESEIALLEEAAERANEKVVDDENASGLSRLLLGSSMLDFPLRGLLKNTNAFEYSAIQLATAQCLLALLTASLRLRGIDATANLKEKERIESAISKLGIDGRPSIDLAAADRIIKHNICAATD